jgi:hypothetical protein
MKQFAHIFLSLLILLSSCTIRSHILFTKEQRKLVPSLHEFLVSKIEAGSLPGFSLGEHGSIDASGKFREKITYPYTPRVEAEKDTDPPGTKYYYFLRKESEDSPWVIQGAIKSLPNGEIENLKVD